MRQLAFLLYIPPMFVTGAISVLCSLLLARGERSGLFVILYAGMTYVLFRRARKIQTWEAEEADEPLDVRKDVWLLSVINLILFSLMIAYYIG